MLGNVLSVLADAELNVLEMMNQSRNEIAYNIVDVEGDLPTNLGPQIYQVEGVIGVRTLGSQS